MDASKTQNYGFCFTVKRSAKRVTIQKVRKQKNRFFLPNVFGKKEICASFFTLLVLLKTDEVLRKRASFLKNKTKFCFILSQTLQAKFPKHSFIFVCFSF